MNKFRVFTFGLFLMITCSLLAQGIIRTVDVHWAKKDIYLFDFKQMDIPTLHIKYTNSSSDSLYFYLPLDEYPNLPNYPNIIPETILMINYGSYADCYLDFTKKQSISSSTFHFKIDVNTKWAHVKNNSFDDNYYDDIVLLLEKQHELNLVQPQRQLIPFNYPNKEKISFKEIPNTFNYDSLQHEQKLYVDSLNNPLYSSLLKTRELNENIERIQQHFKCLSPGSSFEFMIDLTPFAILGGKYILSFSNALIYSEICYTSSDNNQPQGKKHHEDIYEFPKLYHGYRLFEGKFKSNQVIIDFSH